MADREMNLRVRMESNLAGDDPIRRTIAGLREAAEAEKKYQELLGGRIKKLEEEKRLRGDLAKMGYGAEAGAGAAGGIAGALGLPAITGPLAALALSVRAADSAIKGYTSSLVRGQFVWNTFQDQIAGSLSSIPILGSALQHASRDQVTGANIRRSFGTEGPGTLEGGMSYFERERQLRLSEMVHGAGAQTAGVRAQTDMQERAALLQAAEFKGLVRYGVLSAGAQGQIGFRAQREVEHGLAVSGGRFGITREQEMEDFTRRARTQQHLDESRVEFERQQQVLGGQRRYAQGHEAEALKGVLAARAEQATQAGAVEAAGQFDAKGRVRAGYEPEAEIKARDRLSEATAHAALAEEQLRVARQATLKIDQEELQLKKTQAQTRADILRQEHAQLSQQIVQEKARQRGLVENMGLMRADDIFGIKWIAGKISTARKKGEEPDFNQAEREFMASHPELFRAHLQKEGARRAKAMGLQDTIDEIGLPEILGARGGERGGLEANFKIDVNVSAEGLADVLTKALLPKVHEIIESMKVQGTLGLERILNLLNRGQAATGK